MPWAKGQSGNPGGRIYSGKPWVEALRVAVNRLDPLDKSRKILARLAEKTVEMALDGDMAAIREIADRLDGKPAQAIIGDDEHPVEVTISDHELARRIAYIFMKGKGEDRDAAEAGQIQEGNQLKH